MGSDPETLTTRNPGLHFGWLDAGLVGLAVLAVLAPWMAGEHSESRVGLLLVLAALVQIHHGFRRAPGTTQKSFWQGGAVTLLMGVLVLHDDSLAFSAFVIFLAVWFAVDALRYLIRGLRKRDFTSAAWMTWILPALGNGAVACFLLARHHSATSWTIAIVAALRIFGIAWELMVSEVYSEADSAHTAVDDLGLGRDPRLIAEAERLETEEAARESIDRGWIFGFAVTLFAIHLSRMGFDHSAIGVIGPAFAVFGDMVVALAFAYLLVVPFRLFWRRSTRSIERRAWVWSVSKASGRIGRWARRMAQRWLSGRLRFAIRLRLARYSMRSALQRGLQIGLPLAAVLAAVIPVLGMSWYFDTENWAAGIWDSWAAARTDVWREAMVKGVNAQQPARGAGEGRGTRAAARATGTCA